MRKFLIIICTFFITGILILFGIVSNIENVIIDTVDVAIQKEIQNNLTGYLKENTDYNEEDIQKGLNELLVENEIIKTTLNKYMDKMFDMMISEKTEELNIVSEVEQRSEEHTSELQSQR